jgi:hypothetical protein
MSDASTSSVPTAAHGGCGLKRKRSEADEEVPEAVPTVKALMDTNSAIVQAKCLVRAIKGSKTAEMPDGIRSLAFALSEDLDRVHPSLEKCILNLVRVLQE